MDVRHSGLHSACLSLIAVYSLIVVVSLAALATMDGQGKLFVKTVTAPPCIYLSDFVNFYTVGTLSRSPERLSAYDPNAQMAQMNEIISPLKLDTPFIAQSVPWFFALMVPFSLLPLKQAYLLFEALGTACGLLGLAIVSVQLCRRRLATTTLILTGALASVPAFVCWLRGQSSWLILGAACLYYLCLVRKRNIWAGVFLAVTSMKPQYTIFLALPALAGRRWKLLASLCLCELLLLAVAACFIGIDNVVNYPRTLMAADTNTSYIGILPGIMICLRALFMLFLPAHASMQLSLLVFVCSLAALFAMWRKVLRADQPDLRLPMAVTVIASLLASPHTSLYDGLLLALPAVALFPSGPCKSSELTEPSGSTRALRPLLYLLALYPLISWVCFLLEEPQATVPHVAIIVLNILVLAASLYAFFGRDKEPTVSGT